MTDDRNAIPGDLSPYGHKTLARCIGVPAMKPDTTQIVMTSTDGLTVVMDSEPDDKDRALIWRIMSGQCPPHSVPGAVCYQDAEGTIPAASGDPVRYVRIPNWKGRLRAMSQRTLASTESGTAAWFDHVREELAAEGHRINAADWLWTEVDQSASPDLPPIPDLSPIMSEVNAAQASFHKSFAQWSDPTEKR